MKITKFEQSCLLVGVGDVRILIDPGNLSTNRPVSEYGKLDCVLYTHLHADHFDQKTFDEFIGAGVPTYLNQALFDTNGGKGNIVADQDVFITGSVEVKAIELAHCLMPDGSEGPQNTGYLINNQLFHPGDGVDIDGLSADILALPITGPDVSMKDAFAFAKKLGAKTAIPIHYDTLGANADIYKTFAERFNMPFVLEILSVGDSLEI